MRELSFIKIKTKISKINRKNQYTIYLSYNILSTVSSVK